MPIPLIVPPSTPQWDYELSYPAPRGNILVPSGVVAGRGDYLANGRVWYNTTSLSRSVELLATAGGGTTVHSIDFGGANGGFLYVRKAGTAGWQRNDLNGMRCVTPVDPAVTIAAGASLPSSQRVWILQVLLRWEVVGGNPGNLSGVIVQPDNNAAQHGWPTEPVGASNRGGFGIVGDGAGNWVHNSYDRTGVALVRYTNVLAAHDITEWNLAEFQIIGNRPGIPATLEVWFNGALVTTRNWTGADLELPQAQECRFVPWIGEGPNGTSCFAMHVRRGRFTRLGVEL